MFTTFVCINIFAALLLQVKYMTFLFRFVIILPLFSLLAGGFAIFNFVTPGEALIYLTNNIYITEKGLMAFLKFYLRILNVSSLTGIYIMKGGGAEFLRGLKGLNAPEEIILIFSLTLRYIQIFAKDLQDFLIAKKLRIFNPAGTLEELKWTGSRAFLLFKKGIKESMDVNRGLILRGAIDRIKYPAVDKMNQADFICLIITGLIVAGVVIVDRVI
jgi:energy-coupling factor transporter transmembrane protein EcfT